MDNNTRTMKLMGVDDWDRPVYKCIETDTLYKDINLGSGEPALHSCNNCFDGEPDMPVKSYLGINFIDKYLTEEQEFEYQMLDRLKGDCDYYLGYGNRFKGHLYYHEEKEHLSKMKELYNSFPDDMKPEWLTWEQILEYEKSMLKDI